MPTVPARMTAIAIRQPGPPDVLVPQERDTPVPKQGEVLVKVVAAGVNRPDVMQREGKYPPPPGAPDIPGLELAGEVVALGEGVQRWKVGDKVTALVPGGGYAEYAVAHEPTRCRSLRRSRWPRRARSPKPSLPSGTTYSSAAR